MKLQQGYTYRGRAIISTPWGVDHENAKAKLEEKGFTNVKVWLKGDTLPADWRSDAVSDESGAISTQVWAEVTWPGSDTDMEPSGTGYEIIEPVWVYASMTADKTQCFQEGYSCVEGSATPCCPGTSCGQDSESKFGGGLRCMPDGSLQPPKKSSVGSILLTLGVLGIGAFVGWEYIAPAVGLRAKKNPTGNAQQIAKLKREMEYWKSKAAYWHDLGDEDEEEKAWNEYAETAEALDWVGKDRPVPKSSYFYDRGPGPSGY